MPKYLKSQHFSEGAGETNLLGRIAFMYVHTMSPHSQNSYPTDKAEGLRPTGLFRYEQWEL